MESDTITGKSDERLAQLCAEHLEHEETLLAAASRIARAILAAFKARGPESFRAALQGQAEVAAAAVKMNARRRRFHEEAARLTRTGASDQPISLTDALAALGASHRARLEPVATRVRHLAQELADLNYRVSVHIRVHLNAYRSILNDLTGTSPSSGRYGPAGTAESADYRPLLLLHG